MLHGGDGKPYRGVQLEGSARKQERLVFTMWLSLFLDVQATDADVVEDWG